MLGRQLPERRKRWTSTLDSRIFMTSAKPASEIESAPLSANAFLAKCAARIPTFVSSVQLANLVVSCHSLHASRVVPD